MSAEREIIKQSVPDELIDELSFVGPKMGASYALQRKSVTYHAMGGNEYTPSGVKVIRFNLTGEDFMDPTTIRVMFDIENTDATADKPNKNLRGFAPYGFFRRARLLCRGQLLEDIDNFNRISEMTEILMSKFSHIQNNGEGFGLVDNPENLTTSTAWIGIAKGAKQTVCFRPIFGLFYQKQYLPLKWMPLQVELELVNALTDAIVITSTGFVADNTSLSWSISNCQMKMDAIKIDSGLMNHYDDHFQHAGVYKLHCSTYSSQYQTIPNGSSINLNITRALSFLEKVFISFHKSDVTAKFYKKEFNDFYHPLTADNLEVYQYTKTGDIQSMQIQIGSTLYPEYPMTSAQECFYQLKKALGVQANHLHSFNITPREYLNNKFVIGFDMETISSAAYTAKDIRSGDLMTIKGTWGGDQTNLSMHVVLQHQIVIAIDASGCSVME
jgi:hypothetical protein